MNRNRIATGVHIVLAVVGGYIVASTLISLTAASLIDLAGMPRSEAVILSSMLGFIIYLVILIWSFAERSVLQLALKLCLLGVAAYALLHLLNRYGA